MNFFTRIFLGERVDVDFLQIVRQTSSCLRLTKKVFVKVSLCFMVFFSSFDLAAQTTYDWFNTAPDGNFRTGAAGARWTGGLFDEPSSNSGTRLRFNNNTFTIMTNNVPGVYTIGQLFFGSSATTSRSIGGNSVQFFEFSGTWPRIENQSTTLHTINFPFAASSNTGFNMELVASSGNINFGSLATINNNGRVIQIYGNNSVVDANGRAIRLTGTLSGSGALNVSQFGTAKLNSIHTYTGQTLIDNGELWIESGGGISASSGIAVGNTSMASNFAKLWLSNSTGGTTFSNNLTISNGNLNTRVIGGLNTSGTQTFSGNFTNNSINFNLSALNAGGVTDFTGVISGSNAITTEGAGIVRLSGTNTYTGSTTISGGTLQLGATNAIPNTAITISNNSTLNTGASAGFNETLGLLTVTNGATIVLGTGAHALNFAASNGATWSGTVTLNGWAPSAGQIFFANSTGLTGTQLGNINFTGFGTGARILATGEIVPAYFYFSDIASGDFTNGAHWLGGVAPVAGSTAVIRSGHNMMLTTSISLANLTINTGGTFTASDATPRILTISNGASSTSLSNSGIWANGVGGSTVVFSSTGANVIHTISGNCSFNNVTISRTTGTPTIGLTFSSASTINNNFQIDAGGFVQTTPPTYGSLSTLIYNNGANFGIATEWTAGATSGAGYPNNVQLGSTAASSGLSISNGNTYNMAGNLTFSNTIGSNLLMTSSTLNIGGNWVNNTTNTVNFTRGTGTVGFTGSGNNTIGGTNVNAGGYAFNNLTINKTSSGTITLNNAITVANSLTVNGTSTFSLNGNNLSVVNLIGSSTTAIINNNHASTNVVLTVTDGGNYTFAGRLQNGGGAGTLGLTKLGVANSLTLSGLNSYTGTTTLSGAGRLFLTNNMTLGPLNMTATSNIDLGAGATGFTVNFANSNTPAWTGTLTIFNWTPSAGKIINVAGVGPAGLTTAQLAQTNIDNYGVGSKFVGIKVRPAFLYVTVATGGGDYTIPGSWLLGDLPVLNNGSESIYVQPGFSLNMDASAPTINVLRAEVGTGGTFIMNLGDIVNISNTGDFRVNGTITMSASAVINLAANTNFQIGGTVNMTSTSVINFASGISLVATSPSANFSSAGILNFLGAFTITSSTHNAVLLPNVNLRASVNFGDNSTIRSGSSLFMLPGGFINTNPPTYAVGSTLTYQTGGDYGRGLEWSATSGRGYPHHVTITTSNPFRLGNGSPTVARQIGGDLTIGNNTQFTMEDGAGFMNVPLTVLGNVNVNGELRLGGGIGGDIRVGGNYTAAPTSGANGTTFNNSRAVIFVGNVNQFVTKTGGGIIYFDFLVVDKPSGDLKMTSNTNAYITAPANNLSGLRVLQLVRGDIDMNDGIITVEGDGLNSIIVLVDNGPSSRRIYTSTGSGEFRIIGTNTGFGVTKFTVVSRNSGKLLFDNDVEVSTTVGVDFGAGNITTIKSKLRIDQNGYVIVNSPNYGVGSVLIYNNGSGGYNRNFEWNTNTYGSLGTGFPDSVIVQNNTQLDLNFYSFTAGGLGCSGKLWIQPGSSIVTGTMSKPLSIGDSLVIDGTLTLSTNAAGDITVGGSWKRTGTFVQNDRMVTFDGTNDGTLAKSASIQATPGQIFSRMTINKNTTTSSIRVVDSVTITKELFLERGALTLNNDIIIKSDNINGIARIGQTTNLNNISITYGTGKFEIQRYLPIANTTAARRWRLLTAPIKSDNAPSINSVWQEGQTSTNRNSPSNTRPGFGTAITKGTIAANGYDQGSTNNPSILSYISGTDLWGSLTATNTGKITDLPGYMLFVRGDRSIIVAGTNVLGSPTNLRVRGEINIGEVTTALNSSGFQVLGNPYASAITFNSVLYNGVNPGTTAGRTFSLWDPKAGGNNNVGGWVNFTSLGTGLYTVTGSNISGFSNTGVVESGAAFLVPGIGGSFTFSENCKIAASSTTGIASRPANNPAIANNMDFFTCKLFAVSGTSGRLTDVVVNVGSKSFENEVNEKDAPKLFSFSSSENVSILRQDQKLTAELKNRMTADDTISYYLSKLNQASYHLALIGKDIDNTLVGIVEDKFLKTATIINVNDTNIIPFNVTSDTAFAADRFSVVFKSSAGFTNIKAAVVNNDIVVDWNLISEFRIVNYEVERSSDGITFNTVGNVLSSGNSFMAVKYNWIDVSPYHGLYYYRIKAVNSNGVAIYSNITKVKLMKSTATTYIAPNPVTNNIIHLQMNNMSAGIYSIRLLNSTGQVIQTSTINHPGTNTQHTISLAQSTAKGTYQVELSAKGKKAILLPVLIQ